MEKICLLGASGSIGRQTLEVIKEERTSFELVSFSVGHNDKVIEPILKDHPEVESIYLIDEKKALVLANKYPHLKVFSGVNGLKELCEETKATMVVNGLVGFSGLVPSFITLKRNLKLALANKESLVVGGELIDDLLKKGKGKLYPIDSEHSAILKCLLVEDKNVDKLILTASGGAFRKLKKSDLEHVSKEDALRHPTWEMGEKITIDSATMVNKCFEIIEAHYLFSYPYSKIKVLLHDESMIHSLVRYKDGTHRAEISEPDMKNPIRFALFENNYPFETFLAMSYEDFGPYHFQRFCFKRYPLVKWAKKVIEEKGIFGAVLNASNEIAVEAFLKDQIGFLTIDKIINTCMEETQNIVHPNLEVLIEVDAKTRLKARELVEKWSK
ncbi:MAG: 1-deoxy-D-xylulose-5-phosphate reductoisomerase [Erysipelotrichia bacterium]|nr:1-deoxy-D-xylulose-5-phosphate reductoisomerase [Erysipelotrichia bacterium]